MDDARNESTPESERRGPGRLVDLPVDRGNPAPQVRAYFQFQDDCAALVLLGHIGDAALEAVVIERATDLILVPTVGDPELVSIKHRESNRSGTVAWTWTALQKDNVLTDLHAKWLMYEKKATLAFWSSVSSPGFGGELVSWFSGVR